MVNKILSLLLTQIVCPYIDYYEDFPIQAEQWIDSGRGIEASIKTQAHRLGSVFEPLIA